MGLMRLEQEDRNAGWDADEGTFTMLFIEFYYANGNFQEGMGLAGEIRHHLTVKY